MVSISIGGDFVPNNSVDNINLTDLQKHFAKSDISIINLESPILRSDVNNYKSIKKTGPSLYCKIDSSEILKELGVDAVTLANNHMMDFYSDGLKDTVNILKEIDVDFIGAGTDKEEIKKPLIFDVKNTKIGFLNYCENEFSTLKCDLGCNGLDSINNFYDIQDLRKNVDFLIVILHSGHEGYNLPSPEMKKRSRYFVDLGVDAIITHHSHCLSGYEIYKGKPIFYGVGNLFFPWDNKVTLSDWNYGYIVNLFLENGIVNFQIHPYIQSWKDISFKFLEGSVLKEVVCQIDTYNSIINDDKILNKKFIEFCTLRKNLYLSILYPYNNRYLTALAKRNLLPKFLSSKKMTYMLNFLRCEAHLNMFDVILQSQFNKKNNIK